MTELEHAITATLRADAQEAAMNTDTARESHELEARLDAADRSHRRRTWTVVAVAAAVVAVAVVGVRAVGGAATGEAIAPVPPAGEFYSTSTFVVPFTITLPAWTTGIAAQVSEEFDRHAYWEQSDCVKDGAPAACIDGSDLKLGFIAPVALYRPQDGPTVSPVPDYAGYVAYLMAIAATGDVRLSDLSSTTVDGRPATLMTLAPQKALYGAVGCASEFDSARDCWGLIDDDSHRVDLRLAVIDVTGQKPIVAWTATNRNNARAPQLLAELDTMLMSLRFAAAPQPSGS